MKVAQEVQARTAEALEAAEALAEMGARSRRDRSLLDAHMAETVAQRALQGRLCWSAGLGWLRWDGRRWKATTDATVAEVVRRDVVAQLDREARAGADSERLKNVSSLLSAGRIRAIAGLCKGIVEVDADQFDRHPDLLNVGNGVVDLTTGELRPHDPGLRLTKVTPIEYRVGARHPDWEAALRALPEDVAAWMQVRIGQAATGHMTPDDLLPVLQGSGANGKTTVTAAIRRALGEHAAVVPERVLLANPSDHPTELMTLRGARLALIEETPEARHLSVKRLKDVVGTPTMTARLIRRDNVSWEATHSLVLTTNYRPRVDESDHGTWRRLALVRFPFKFAGALCDPGLRERLSGGRQGQLEAVLAWVVDGARVWYALDRTMPAMPATVSEDTQAWRGEADQLYAFISEELEFDPAACVLATELHSFFTTWILARGGRAWADQTFAGRFAQHAMVEAHQVTKTRARDLSGLSRRVALPMAPGGRTTVWQGIRWRTGPDGESAGQSGVDRGGQGSSVNPLGNPFARVNGVPLSTPGQQPGEVIQLGEARR